MSLTAIIGGANSISAIHQYIEVKESLFKELFEIERAPCYRSDMVASHQGQTRSTGMCYEELGFAVI